jgi:Raf kinase inhibitor-like YbhB/YbcL family protein
MSDELMPIVVKSTAFHEGEAIPARYTADGADVSPPLTWSGVPDGTRSLAVVCEDPDAPRGTWAHWVLFNLPADARQLAEGVPPEPSPPGGGMHGTNSFGKLGYGGPSPPPGKPHRYYFKLFALNATLPLEPGAARDDVLRAVDGRVLGEGWLMGRYGRKPR